jgi:hypothetical protein
MLTSDVLNQRMSQTLIKNTFSDMDCKSYFYLAMGYGHPLAVYDQESWGNNGTFSHESNYTHIRNKGENENPLGAPLSIAI